MVCARLRRSRNLFMIAQNLFLLNTNRFACATLLRPFFPPIHAGATLRKRHSVQRSGTPADCAENRQTRHVLSSREGRWLADSRGGRAAGDVSYAANNNEKNDFGNIPEENAPFRA